MKNSLILVALLSVFANIAFAEDTATINTSANINASCKFSSAEYIVDFGNLKHSQNFVLSQLNKNLDLMFECTNGTQASIGAPSFLGGPVLRGPSGAQIPYSVSNRAGFGGNYVGLGYGNSELIKHGYIIAVPPANFLNARPGSYQGVFQVTVNY